MRVFISHSQNDEKLAINLQKILEKENEIKHVFIFEKKRKYGIQIEQKIIKEILSSDYLIALVTKDAKESASVNQELGYAQAKNIPVIPLIEKNAKKGFLVFGADYITFTKRNFEKSCKKIVSYILENGPRVKDEETFTPQELLIQKSAHYRYWIEYDIGHLIDSSLYHLDIEPDKYRKIIFSSKPEERLKGLRELKVFIKNLDNLKHRFLKLNYYHDRKFSFDYDHFARSLKNYERYPHTELLPDETDIIIKINDFVEQNNDEESLNLEKFAQYRLGEDFPKNSITFEETLRNIPNDERKELERQFDYFVSDVSIILNLVIELQEIYEKIKEKYGDLGIKSPQPDYSV